jgi:type VI secretion system protein
VAFEQSLLERMDHPEQGGYRLAPDPHRTIDSILTHLRKMLNVRQGSVSTLPDYGIPDLNSLFMQYPDGVLALRRIIKELLEKYEPRLRQINVRYLPDDENPLILRYEINARLVIEGDEPPIRFETAVGDNGKVRVRG